MSTAIRHMYYKPDQQELSVWFGPDFRRYKYFEVPEHLYEAMRQAESRGQFFNTFIRGRFECRRVEEPDRRRKSWSTGSASSPTSSTMPKH